MTAAALLPPRRYALGLTEPVVGARDRHAVLSGTLIGYAMDAHQGWMTAADLPGRPQWSAAVLRFAHQVAKAAALAAAQGQPWPDHLAALWNTAPRLQIPLQLTAALGDIASGLVDRLLAETGCRALKLKVDMATDEAALAQTLSPLLARHRGLELRLDANQSWDSLSPGQLHQRLKACADLGVALVEDPVLPANWPADSPVPLAADLIDSDVSALQQLARRGLLSLAVVKPSLCGSLEEFEDLVRELAALRVPVALSSLFDAPAGLAMLAGLAAAMPGQLAASGLATHLGLPPLWRPPALQPVDGSWPVKNLWRGSDVPNGPPVDLCADLWAQAALDAADLPALAWTPTGQTWTYAQLDQHIDAAGAWLCSQGVQLGDRVLLWADNSPELAVALAACWRIGAVAAPLHPRLTHAEVGALQQQIAPAVCLHGLGQPPLQSGHAPWLPLGTWPAMAWSSCPRRYTELAALVATSGTTGQPKLAMLGHPALQAAAFAHWHAMPPQPQERWLACLTLGHVSGMMVLLRCVAARACVVLTADARLPELTAALRRWRPTTLSVVPTLLARLLEGQAASGDLRVVLVGGASCDPGLLAQARRAGWPVRATYGMTETCAQLATAREDEPLEEQEGLRRIGPAVPGMQARVAGGTAQGEIEVAGCQLFMGYWGQAERRTAAGHEPLWWLTGDHGRVDSDGVLWVASRRADRIQRGGENIDPLEVEAALQAIPGVLEVAVAGLPDPHWGEIVAAWVVTGSEVSAFAVQAREGLRQLASFKRPEIWLINAEPLPRNSLGKLLRAQVRQRLLESQVEQRAAAPRDSELPR